MIISFADVTLTVFRRAAGHMQESVRTGAKGQFATDLDRTGRGVLPLPKQGCVIELRHIPCPRAYITGLESVQDATRNHSRVRATAHEQELTRFFSSAESSAKPRPGRGSGA